jgi:hypothetical protein
MLLTEHVDSVISATDDAKLTRHLAACPDCTADLREQLAARTLLQAEPFVAVPRSFALPYAPRTVHVSDPSGITKLLRAMQVATATAAIVLVALVGLSVLQTSPTTVTPSLAADSLAPSVEFAAGATEKARGTSTSKASAPSTNRQSLITTAHLPNVDADTTERVDSTAPAPAPAPAKDGAIIAAVPSLPQGEFAPKTTLSSDSTLTNDRPALEWALLTTSFTTALLALAVVAVTSRSHATT